MAKNKPQQGAKGAPNKHLVARIAFLHQAALSLASQAAAPSAQPESTNPTADHDTAQLHELDTNATRRQPPRSGLPFYFTAQLKQVALKSQVRLQTDVKRAICKACNAMLIEHQTCITGVENLSRGGKKDKANVSVVECLACGCKRRVPLGAARQQKKSKREVPKIGSAAHADEPIGHS